MEKSPVRSDPMLIFRSGNRPLRMFIIFLKGYCVLVRVEIIHKSKFLPGTVEKNSELQFRYKYVHNKVFNYY